MTQNLAAGLTLVRKPEPPTAAALHYRRRMLLAHRATLATAETAPVMLDPPVTIHMPAAQLLDAIGADLAKVEGLLAEMGELV